MCSIIIRKSLSNKVESHKLKQPLTNYRPDITHQCLLTLQDSIINKLGCLKVLVHTKNKHIIQISPQTRIPRTYSRFAPLFAQLLTRLKVRASQSSDILLKLVKGPIDKLLPPGPKIALSSRGDKIKVGQLIQPLIGGNVTFIIGAVSKGNPTMQVDYYQKAVSISQYGLSANYCISKLLHQIQSISGY